MQPIPQTLPSSTFEKSALWWAVLLSILLHLVIAGLAPFFSVSTPKVDLASESVEVFMPDLQARPQPGQLVELNNRDASLTAPADSKYLSDLNRLADRQTQAANTGVDSKASRPSKKANETTAQKETSESSPSKPDSVHVGDSEKKALNLKLPSQFLAALAPQAPSNYLPGIELGNETLLNTREYIYAPFFIRMKQGLERVWNPQRALKNNSRALDDEYRTSLQIILNRDGSIASVKVMVSSSLTALDDEAVRAVYKAAPYVNPPKDLIESDGKIHITDFHFIVSQRHSLF
jgi:TonB family protein